MKEDSKYVWSPLPDGGGWKLMPKDEAPKAKVIPIGDKRNHAKPVDVPR